MFAVWMVEVEYLWENQYLVFLQFQLSRNKGLNLKSCQCKTGYTWTYNYIIFIRQAVLEQSLILRAIHFKASNELEDYIHEI